jgi:hypothetical protein
MLTQVYLERFRQLLGCSLQHSKLLLLPLLLLPLLLLPLLPLLG